MRSVANPRRNAGDRPRRRTELIDWVRKVSPERAVAVHDAAIHPTGMAVVGGLLGENGPGVNATYDRLEPMRSYEV